MNDTGWGSCPLGEMIGHTHITMPPFAAAYPCVVSPAGPGTSVTDWAKWPSSPSSALHPSGACLHHLSSPHPPPKFVCIQTAQK